MSIVNVEKMTVVERLQTLEALWDSLAHHSVEPLTPPEWHREILAGRVKAIRADTAQSMTLDELAARKHAQD
jgi:putative addiction module component (TIGR02574 family)